jgi:hypothetical protein
MSARPQVLRMQTNPHFLFNTLSSIAGLVQTRPAAAQSMATRLGELFRATLADRNVDFVLAFGDADRARRQPRRDRCRRSASTGERTATRTMAVHARC